jgi:hypothetical protein
MFVTGDTELHVKTAYPVPMHSSRHSTRYSKEYLHNPTEYQNNNTESGKSIEPVTAADAARLWATGEKGAMNVAYKIWRETKTSQSDIEAYKESELRQKFGL